MFIHGDQCGAGIDEKLHLKSVDTPVNQIHAYAVGKIKVVGLFKDKAIVTIDGKQRVLSKGKTSPEGILLISANSREAVIEIDGIAVIFAGQFEYIGKTLLAMPLE